MEKKEFSIHCISVEHTKRLGKLLGQCAEKGMIFALDGPLGAGKTHLTQGIAIGLGIPEDDYIVSPTFVIVIEHHTGRLPLYHVDLYRLEEAEEAGEIGLEEMMTGEGVTVIEWANKFPEMIPEDGVWINIEILNEEHRVFNIILPEKFDNLVKLLSKFS